MSKLVITDQDVLNKIQNKYYEMIGGQVDTIQAELKYIGVKDEDFLTLTNAKGEKLTLTTKEMFDSFKTNITDGYALELLKMML